MPRDRFAVGRAILAERYQVVHDERIFARTGGNGPPLLLLHGYPQTHVMWHRIAAALAERFSLVIPDLPGYGSSDIPATDAEHTPYTKRAMAAVMVEVMEKQGYNRFALVGHDRGGASDIASRWTSRSDSHGWRYSTYFRPMTIGRN